MNFNEATLPDFLIADLYKNNLVLVDNELPISAKPEISNNASERLEEVEKKIEELVIAPKKTKEPLAFLGKNQKNISIVVLDDQAIHLQDDLLEILSTILSACKLNLADVAIVNSHAQIITASILKNELSPKVVLLFGVATTTIELPFSIPDYKIQQFDNCNYLQAATLSKMRGATGEVKDEKRKLWACLKTLFNI